jgi:hypothetical protein
MKFGISAFFKDFREIWYFGIFRRIFMKFDISVFFGRICVKFGISIFFGGFS